MSIRVSFFRWFFGVVFRGESVGSYWPDEWFPPAARLDEFVAILQSPSRRQYARVVWFEPIPLYEYSFDVDAGATLSDQELKELVVGENEVLQLRFATDGVCKIGVSLPRATKRFALRSVNAYFDANIAGFPKFPPQTELHVLEDSTIFVTLENPVARLERQKLYITGWRLVVEPVEKVPENYTALIVQGFAPATSVRR